MFGLYFNLFIVFFKIGLFTIGGGYAMIPLIEREILDHGWLGINELIDIIAISEMTPGPFAINTATFVGIDSGGLLAAAFSTGGVVFPSFVIIIAIARYFTHFREHPIVQSTLYGLRPAVIGLIASAAFVIAKASFFNMSHYTGMGTGLDFDQIGRTLTEVVNFKSLFIFGVVVVGNIRFKIHPILLIIAAGGLGIVLF